MEGGLICHFEKSFITAKSFPTNTKMASEDASYQFSTTISRADGFLKAATPFQTTSYIRGQIEAMIEEFGSREVAHMTTGDRAVHPWDLAGGPNVFAKQWEIGDLVCNNDEWTIRLLQ